MRNPTSAVQGQTAILAWLRGPVGSIWMGEIPDMAMTLLVSLAQWAMPGDIWLHILFTLLGIALICKCLVIALLELRDYYDAELQRLNRWN